MGNEWLRPEEHPSSSPRKTDTNLQQSCCHAENVLCFILMPHELCVANPEVSPFQNHLRRFSSGVKLFLCLFSVLVFLFRTGCDNVRFPFIQLLYKCSGSRMAACVGYHTFEDMRKVLNEQFVCSVSYALHGGKEFGEASSDVDKIPGIGRT